MDKECKLYKRNRCYDISFKEEELKNNEDKIVTKYFDFLKNSRGNIIPITNIVWNKNKCPFLTKDFGCNIFKNKPNFCK